MKNKIVIIGAARTPVGSFLGELKDISAQELGVIALKEAVKRIKIDKEEIDEVIVGNVIETYSASNLAKVIALDYGLPYEVTAYTVNRVCGSGIQSIINGYQDLMLGKRSLIAAGGVESLSRAPYVLPENTRSKGFKLGDFKILDSNLEIHRSLSGKDSEINHMAETAANVIDKYEISREEQDIFAYESQMKASKSIERLKEEIVPIEIKQRDGSIKTIDIDGDIRQDISIEKLSKLRPAFDKDGSITAGNACSLNDGAAFVLMTTENKALQLNQEILAEIIDYEVVGLDPSEMGLGPVKAINQLLENNNLDLIEDIDLLEINEAFAGQVLGCLKELDVDMDSDFYRSKFNVNGGAIAIGHPLGMSGTRLIVSAAYEFKHRPDANYAIVSACIGGGQGIAMLLKNPNHKKEVYNG